MPLVYQQNINVHSKIGVWHISEAEDFFEKRVPLQRNITHPHKRLQHLAGRYLLVELYPDFPHDLIKIADTNKPYLENEAYHFSISHCGDYAAVIVSTHKRVGVDIEMINEKVERIKHKFLKLEEQALLQNNPALLTAAWGIKESLFKWYGNKEVDFKQHLKIEKIVSDTSEGIAQCLFLKNTRIQLNVHFLFFNSNCLCWVLSN